MPISPDTLRAWSRNYRESTEKIRTTQAFEPTAQKHDRLSPTSIHTQTKHRSYKQFVKHMVNTSQAAEKHTKTEHEQIWAEKHTKTEHEQIWAGAFHWSR
jgi:hypothetical protein